MCATSLLQHLRAPGERGHGRAAAPGSGREIGGGGKTDVQAQGPDAIGHLAGFAFTFTWSLLPSLSRAAAPELPGICHLSAMSSGKPPGGGENHPTCSAFCLPCTGANTCTQEQGRGKQVGRSHLFSPAREDLKGLMVSAQPRCTKGKKKKQSCAKLSWSLENSEECSKSISQTQNTAGCLLSSTTVPFVLVRSRGCGARPQNKKIDYRKAGEHDTPLPPQNSWFRVWTCTQTSHT